MRFAADGPNIPDDLLLARDQGRVVFFCGAGVSRARTGLPDFLGLARTVTSSLGVSEDSAAQRLLSASQEIEKITGIPGVVSADRVFGQLEGDFLTRDVEASVAAALKPPTPCDLSAHQLLLDLATTPDGLVQLVTTNFDRLFDDCGRNLPTWKPPRLPNPARPADMNGVVYLHGRAAHDYSGAEDEGFVLSSSSFGRAYLSDGWATQFFKDVIQTYVVVFVGYAADDPPVQYLLEALSNAAGELGNTYAFQAGKAADAAAGWRRKGVRAIPYDNLHGSHEVLWQTLEAWADRARDINSWYDHVLAKAKAGPNALSPHERGQVAHMISTYEGAKRFAEALDPPPAEWLCVFDRLRRYERPGYLGRFGERGAYVDPFDVFGLDSDEVPKRIGPEDRGEKRDVPASAWDAFSHNRWDLVAPRDTELSSFRRPWSDLEPSLVPRLARIGQWLSRVAHQPASFWWALRQGFLHPEIQRSIRWQCHRNGTSWNADIREAWLYLFDAWGDRKRDDSHEWYELEALVRCSGWNNATVRRYAAIRRPRFDARANIWGGPMPQPIAKASDLLWRQVHYPEHHDDIPVPDEWLAATVSGLRRNLDIAVDLENELGGFGLLDNVPIIRDPTRDPSERRIHQSQNLAGLVLEYASLLTRLSEFDNPAARREADAWPTRDDTIFAKLRIWAAGQVSLSSPVSAEEIFTGLSPQAFWQSTHQRDLLIALSARWTFLSNAGRAKIEDKLLQGPESWDGEEPREFEERSASSILNRIEWLSAQGIVFGFDLPATIDTLRQKAPRWNRSFADHAADSMEGRSGWVHTRTEHATLATEPLGSLLIRAERESGRTENFLVENDPYAGLAAQRPGRAFAALTVAAKKGVYPEWAWRTFLNSEARKDDRKRLSCLVSSRLLRMPEHACAALLRPIADWVLSSSESLVSHDIPLFESLIQKLVDVLQHGPPEGQSALVRGNREPDWVMMALNAPVGKLAQALMNDPRKNSLSPGEPLPDAWLVLVSSLLGLGGDFRQHSLAIFYYNLNWFYAVASAWTETELLVAVEGHDTPDKDAAWAGFFWAARVPSEDLYLRIKPHLLQLAKNGKPPLPRGDWATIASIILAGWGDVSAKTVSQYVSDSEMRTVLLKADDAFRVRILWQIEQWANSSDATTGARWSGHVGKLLKDVWPRQASAKSAQISAHLCGLAFSNSARFPVIAPLVLTLLGRLDGDRSAVPNLWPNGAPIADAHPELALALLDAILSDDAQTWPYGIEDVLQAITLAAPGRATDPRYLRLKRRWDAR